MPLQAIIDELLADTGASRVTLRRDSAEGYFGITHEALVPGAPSVRDERTVDLRANLVVQEVLQGRQVVQHDCRSAYDDPEFQRVLDVYGGLAAQIVTPVLVDGKVVGIISVHQLGRPRSWTEHEIELCARAAERVVSLL